MVTKIKGARLKPSTVRSVNELMARNINTLEVKVNQIIGVLNRNNLK